MKKFRKRKIEVYHLWQFQLHKKSIWSHLVDQ